MASISLAALGGTAAASSAAAGTAATSAAIASSTAAATASIAATGAAGIEAASIPLAAAAATPAWLGYTSLGLTALGGITGAIGAAQQGKAAAASARYNADVAGINADQAKRNQELVSEAGMAQTAMQERKTRAEVGQIRANQAAGGVDVNSGSALDVRSSAAELGELDALTVRSNATKEAYGYQTQANTFENETGLDLSEAKNDVTAGTVNATSTFLGAAGTGASNFAKYQLQGGFSA